MINALILAAIAGGGLTLLMGGSIGTALVLAVGFPAFGIFFWFLCALIGSGSD